MTDKYSPFKKVTNIMILLPTISVLMLVKDVGEKCMLTKNLYAGPRAP